MVPAGSKRKETFAKHGFLPCLEVIGNSIAACICLLDPDVFFAGLRDTWHTTFSDSQFGFSTLFPDLSD